MVGSEPLKVICLGEIVTRLKVNPDDVSQTIWQESNSEHLRYEYDLKPEDTVIDIGAYRGEWSSQIFSLYHCKLVLVEPGPWIVGFPIGEVINAAASTHDGKLKFGGAYYYSSSFEDGETVYNCFDVNKLLEKYDEIALVKINIEGAEYDLLSHIINAGLINRIKNLQVQFHTIEDQPYKVWYEEVKNKLLQTHHPTWLYKFCWENWERM